MNVGVQFLREHMPQSARIHDAITDAGGNSPNVVQPHAQVLYMVRSVLAKDALALQERCGQDRPGRGHDDRDHAQQALHRRLLQHRPEQDAGNAVLEKL